MHGTDLDSFLSIVPTGAFTLDREMKIRSINPAAEEMLGLAPGEAIDRTTLWRVAQKQGIPVKRSRKGSAVPDMRRFAYAHRMQMVLVDIVIAKEFRCTLQCDPRPGTKVTRLAVNSAE